MTVRVKRERCILCGGCVYGCPIRAISIHDKRVWIDEQRCNDCGWCIGRCFGRAIMTEERWQKEILPNE